MKTKHTQGNWVPLNHSDTHSGFWRIFQGTKIAGDDFIYDDLMKICTVANLHDGIDNEARVKEAEANAKLIAAAPELLDACIFFLESLPLTTKNMEAKEAMRQAIKKATE